MSSRVWPSRIRRLRLSVRAGAALVLLLVIAADIGAGSRCHRTPGVAARAGWSAPSPSSDQDPCDSGCVPDCYCCSTPAVGPACPSLATSGPAVPVVVHVSRDCSPGIRPLPYHPPLVLA